MRVAFRVDASERIGTGHVMRCLTLAEALREKGAECVFIHRAHSGHMAETIREAGFDVHMLSAPEDETDDTPETDYAAWLGVSQEQDAAETRQAFGGTLIDWLVVDHYGLDAAWERALRDCCRSIAVIDDLANRNHDCDVLVDQTLGRSVDDYVNLVPAGCRLCVGTDYALLRPEFIQMRNTALERRKQCEKLSHLLISLGGSAVEATHRVAEIAFPVLSRKGFRVTITTGRNSALQKQLLRLMGKYKLDGNVFAQLSNIADLMVDADLAIGGTGTMTWERCCLGLPTLSLVLAENQRFASHKLEEFGAVYAVRSLQDLTEGDIAGLCDLSMDRYREIAERSARICDGEGTLKLAGELLNA